MGENGAGPLALVGSGEFLPAMAPIDRRLLAGRPATVAVVPTAAAPEGDRRLRHWIDLARTHYAALDAEVVPVVVRDRSDALRDRFVDAVEPAGLIYLSGGDPGHLTATLRGTPVWETIVERWRGGAALAGCSAGAMALAGWWPPFSAREWREFRPGLGLVPRLAVVPHFDRVVRAGGERLVDAGAHRPAESSLVGIDEDTALVWHDGGWSVDGRGAVWTLDGGAPHALGPEAIAALPRPETVGGG